MPACGRCGTAINFCAHCGKPLFLHSAATDAGGAASIPKGTPKEVPRPSSATGEVPCWMWECGLSARAVSAFDLYCHALRHPDLCSPLGVGVPPALSSGCPHSRRVLAEWWLRADTAVRDACHTAAEQWSHHWSTNNSNGVAALSGAPPPLKRQRTASATPSSYQIFRAANKRRYQSTADAIKAWHALTPAEKAPFDTEAAARRTAKCLTETKEVDAAAIPSGEGAAAP